MSGFVAPPLIMYAPSAVGTVLPCLPRLPPLLVRISARKKN
jgi:hypothetical protein